MNKDNKEKEQENRERQRRETNAGQNFYDPPPI